MTGCRKWTAVQNHVLRSPEASLRSDSGVKFSRVSSSRQEQAAQLCQSPGQMSPARASPWRGQLVPSNPRRSFWIQTPILEEANASSFWESPRAAPGSAQALAQRIRKGPENEPKPSFPFTIPSANSFSPRPALSQ